MNSSFCSIPRTISSLSWCFLDPLSSSIVLIHCPRRFVLIHCLHPLSSSIVLIHGPHPLSSSIVLVDLSVVFSWSCSLLFLVSFEVRRHGHLYAVWRGFDALPQSGMRKIHHEARRSYARLTRDDGGSIVDHVKLLMHWCTDFHRDNYKCYGLWCCFYGVANAQSSTPHAQCSTPHAQCPTDVSSLSQNSVPVSVLDGVVNVIHVQYLEEKKGKRKGLWFRVMAIFQS